MKHTDLAIFSYILWGQNPAGAIILYINVYLSDTLIYPTLKNQSVENECKCQI